VDPSQTSGIAILVLQDHLRIRPCAGTAPDLAVAGALQDEGQPPSRTRVTFSPSLNSAVIACFNIASITSPMCNVSRTAQANATEGVWIAEAVLRAIRKAPERRERSVVKFSVMPSAK
jgi:hypothetical protein